MTSIHRSQSEIEALCQQAARGAGLPWGLAEKAGYAARWLYARGLDGPTALLARLDLGHQISALQIIDDEEYCGDGLGPVCPIAVGAALSDVGEAALGRSALAVSQPLLLLPFLHPIASTLAGDIGLMWTDNLVVVGGDGSLTGPVKALAATKEADVHIGPARVFGTPAPYEPAPLQLPVLLALDDYAMLTTAPTTAQSQADTGSASGDDD